MNKRFKKMLLFLTSFLVIVGAAMLFMPSMIFTASVTPSVVPGNPHCADVGCCSGGTQLKVDPPAEGSYSIGGTDVITVSGFVYVGSDLISFDWSSDKLVFCVIVKGGTEGANVYCYSGSGGSYGDSGLVTPTEQNISHIVFCYDPSTTTTTAATTTTTAATTTTTAATTTTTAATTTTTQPTTTTTAATTTTTQPTTTTTGGTTTTTQPTTTTTGGTTTTTARRTTTTTQPTTTTGTIEVLAFTGYNSLWYVAGSILIALGIIMGTFSLSTALRKR